MTNLRDEVGEIVEKYYENGDYGIFEANATTDQNNN